MTIAELKDRVLAKTGYDLFQGGDVEAAVPTCLFRFARMTAMSPIMWKRELLKKDFSATIASGTSDLSASLTAAEPLLIEFISSAFVTDSNGNMLQYLPDRFQLKLKRPAMFIYFTVDKSTLRTRNTDGSLTSLSTTVTIVGAFAPTLANVPAQLEDDFVDVVVAYLQESVAKGAS